VKIHQHLAGAVAVISLVGCSESLLDFRNAQINHGLIFSGSENKPFSGFVTNVPEKFIQSGSGYNDIIYNLNQNLNALKSQKNTFIGRSFNCSAEVEDGYISGKVSCYQGKSQVLRYTAQYSKGNMSGNLEVYAIDGKTILAKSSFKENTVDGPINIWSPNTGTLVYLRNTKNGMLEGPQINYDETTATPIYKSEAINGKIVGSAQTFSNLGKLITETPYDLGVPHGAAYEWDVNTGQMIKLTTYDHGARTGESKEWTPDGILVSDYIFERGAIIEDKLRPVQPSTQTSNCLNIFINDFHRANGDDTPINSDQLDEWESTCDKYSKPVWAE